MAAKGILVVGGLALAGAVMEMVVMLRAGSGAQFWVQLGGDWRSLEGWTLVHWLLGPVIVGFLCGVYLLVRDSSIVACVLSGIALSALAAGMILPQDSSEPPAPDGRWLAEDEVLRQEIAKWWPLEKIESEMSRQVEGIVSDEVSYQVRMAVHDDEGAGIPANFIEALETRWPEGISMHDLASGARAALIREQDRTIQAVVVKIVGQEVSFEYEEVE